MRRVTLLAGLWLATHPIGDALADSSGSSSVPGNVLLFQSPSQMPIGVCLHRFRTGEEIWASKFGEIESPHWLPPVMHGRLFLIGRQPGVQCVDLRTGRLLWRCDATLEASARAEDSFVVATRDRIQRLDPSTGKELWSIEGGADRTSLWRRDDIIVRIDTTRVLYGHDLGTGRRLWRFEERIPLLGATVGDDVVVASSETSGKLHALDLRTGRQKWDAPIPGQKARPVFWGGRLSVYTADRGMSVLDPLTGREMWSNASIAGVMRWAPDHLLVRTRNEGYACVDAQTGRTVWTLPHSETRRAQVENASFAITIELSDKGGVVSAIDPAAERTLWSLPRTSSTIPPLVLDNRVYQATLSSDDRSWTLRCLDGLTGKVRWSTPLVGPFGRMFSLRKWLIVSQFQYVSAVEASSGRILWRAKCSHASEAGGGSLLP